jgi:hypothetical protein
MSFPLQTATQNNVLAAQLRGALNNGPDWSSTFTTDGASTSLKAITISAGTPSATSTITNTAYSAADIATIATKVNAILALLRNLQA